MLTVSNGKVNYELGGIVWASICNVLGICLEGLKKAAQNFNQYTLASLPGIKPRTSHI